MQHPVQRLARCGSSRHSPTDRLIPFHNTHLILIFTVIMMDMLTLSLLFLTARKCLTHCHMSSGLKVHIS